MLAQFFYSMVAFAALGAAQVSLPQPNEEPSVPESAKSKDATPFSQRMNFIRAQQEEIARTLMQIDPIVFARVHIVCAESSPFIRDQKPARAAVVVKLKPGTALGRKNIVAITAFVAGCVEGLSPENVRIVDSQGRLLSTSDDEARAIRSSHSSNANRLAQLAAALQQQQEALKAREQQIVVREKQMDVVRDEANKERKKLDAIRKEVQAELQLLQAKLLDKRNVERMLSFKATSSSSKVSGRANGTDQDHRTQMTVSDVVRMSKKGISQEIILRQMELTNPVFNLTVDSIIELHDQGVSEVIIRAMQERRAETKAKPAAHKQAAIPFDAIVVNLGEEKLNRYLRMKVAVAVEESDAREVSELLAKQKPFLKSWLICYLSDQSLQEVGRRAGANRIRREVCDQFNQMLFPKGNGKILDISFDEFLAQ